MVKQFQTIEEYYDGEDDDLFFYPPSTKDDDEQLVLLACLLILERYFNQLQSMTPEAILDEIDEKMESLRSELYETAITKVDSTVWESFMDELIQWNIPIFGKVTQDTSMYESIRVSINSLTNQLRDEIVTKATFFKDNMSKDDFTIAPNFKRAIKKVNDAVGNNLQYSKEKSHRKILKFVYGDDKLYRWYSAHLPNTCEWCLMQEKKKPRKIDEWELDHPNGHCVLDPVDRTYSDEYYLILSEMDK